MNPSSPRALIGWKTTKFVEMAQEQVSKLEETRPVVDIPSACQSLLEGYPAKFGELFANREAEAQRSVWEGDHAPGRVGMGWELLEWFVFEHMG